MIVDEQVEQGSPSSPIVACLGGAGSFSEEACRRFLPAHRLVPLGDMAAVVQAVIDGTADLAMVPVENSRTGVIAAHHALIADPQLQVTGEQVLEVRQHLLVIAGATLEGIRIVASHPVALAQCAAWLERWPWEAICASSTAEAARAVADAGDPSRAAIGSQAAAERHGLSILARDLQGEARNETRFVTVERRDRSGTAA